MCGVTLVQYPFPKWMSAMLFLNDLLIALVNRLFHTVLRDGLNEIHLYNIVYTFFFVPTLQLLQPAPAPSLHPF